MTPNHALIRGLRAALAGAAGLLALSAGFTASAQVPAGCTSATPSACRYQPQHNFPFEGHIDLRPLDKDRGNHPVPFRIRYPLNAAGLDPRPLVVWNHGGATTEDDPAQSGVTFGQQGSERRLGSFVQAGYVTVHIGRLMPALEAMTPRMLLTCARTGQFTAAVLDAANPPAQAMQLCRSFWGWQLWGPVNVAFVVDWLRKNAALLPPQLVGSIDFNRIVVGGWSGGGVMPLAIAGADRRWLPPTRLPPRVVGLLHRLGVTSSLLQELAQPVELPAVAVPGVLAFVDDSPRSPSWANGTSGFDEESFYKIDARPFLFTSGRYDTGADNTGPGAAPELSRSVAWWQAAPGHKYLAWSPDVANHASMDLSPGGCVSQAQQATCSALENLGVAFLDAAVLSRPQAQQWLQSDALAVMTGGRIELHRR